MHARMHLPPPMKARPDDDVAASGEPSGGFAVPALAWPVDAVLSHAASQQALLGALAVLTGSRFPAQPRIPESEALLSDLDALRKGERVASARPILLAAAARLPCTTRFAAVGEEGALAGARALGAQLERRGEELLVTGTSGAGPVRFDARGDRELAEAAVLAGLLGGGVSLLDHALLPPERAGLRALVARLHASRRCIAVVGMRGAGKSTFAAAFARRTGVVPIDTDGLFELRHGPIGAFVARAGWQAFRTEEARLVAESPAVESVVATGGGAVEDAGTRARLREAALVVWLDAPPEVLVARLREAPNARPSVTGADVLAELALLHARRAPFYAECAHVRLAATEPPEALVAQALAALSIRSALAALPCMRRR